ncbi:hypothetical protein [Peptoniphilus phoceensis]|uniref:hypothetical protein n=1 Tax=Peptoniphilus phoceensis TaxID=1720298 RepID=UPI0007843689|nr:hypothetical protein [Peptoniphilus phoceensis]
MKYFFKILVFLFAAFLIGVCLDYLFVIQIFSKNTIEVTLIVFFVIIIEKLNKVLEKLEKNEKYKEDKDNDYRDPSK